MRNEASVFFYLIYRCGSLGYVDSTSTFNRFVHVLKSLLSDENFCPR